MFPMLSVIRHLPALGSECWDYRQVPPHPACKPLSNCKKPRIFLYAIKHFLLHQIISFFFFFGGDAGERIFHFLLQYKLMCKTCSHCSKVHKT
jgi:hypothetical protein